MKKDIAVIRASITKVVSLLTRQKIEVTQRGAKAYVEYNVKDGSIKRVNLPYIPDDATPEFISAVQGFLDHEVGHVLFTESSVVVKAKRLGDRVKNLHNLLEDVYIENKMIEAFQGSVGNLESVRKFHVERMALPKIKEALAAGTPDVAVGYIAPIQFRAWGGQTTARDFLRAHPDLAAMVAPLANKIGPALIAQVNKLNSSAEALKLAIAIDKATTPPPPPPPPPAPPSKSPEKGEEGKPEPGEPGEGEAKPEEGDSKPPEDEGKTKTEADDSGKKRDETSETEEAGAAGGDVEGEGDPSADADDADDSDADGEPREEGEEPKAGGDPVGDTSDTDAPAAAGDDEAEGEPADDSASESEGGAAGEDAEGESADGATGEAEGDGGEPTDAPADSADTEASGETGEGAKDEGGGKSKTAGKTVDDDDETDTVPDPREEDTGAAFEEAHDFDEEASEVLSDLAGKAMRASDYKVFSTDWDKVYPAPMAHRSDSIEKMVDKVQHMVAGIQKQLERAMAAQDKKTWNPGQRRGRISPGALFRTATGDDRVFRVRHETRAKNTAVSLLVDCSGSMRGYDRIGTAGLAAFALSSTLERLKIQNEVLGFTTRECGALVRAIEEERSGIKYGRYEALAIPVFKAFHERLTTDAKSRIAHLTEYPSWLHENVDGESLQVAAHRLQMQRAERHVLIVLSDGQPACPGDRNSLNMHLSKVTKDLEAKGVEVVGIGIQTNSVRQFYRRHLVLNNLEELPTTLVGQLAKILLAP